MVKIPNSVCVYLGCMSRDLFFNYFAINKHSRATFLYYLFSNPVLGGPINLIFCSQHSNENIFIIYFYF